MTLLDKLRAKSFWILDKINGGDIFSNYNEVKIMDENPDSAFSVETRRKHLLNLLSHATATTNFYSSYNKGNLESFPVINKTIINSNFDSFISKAIKSQGLTKVTTSGSTGSPLTIYQDKIKRKRHIAENIYY